MTNSRRKPRIVQLPLPGEDVRIPLTKGYETIVSWEDRDLAQFKWIAAHTNGYNYLPYVKRKEAMNQQDIIMHRIILARILGRELLSTEYVDHIDGNSLDNRRGNLRLATPSQNLQNSKRPTDNRSGYKGVSWYPRDKKWRALIQVNRKQIFLGYFDTPEEAYSAYCEAAKKYFGEFARLD